MSIEINCPHCHAPTIHTHQGPVLRSEWHRVYGYRVMLLLAHFVTCSNCTLVSEFNADSGVLTDLGRLTLADLIADESAHLLVQTPTLLRGRHDS